MDQKRRILLDRAAQCRRLAAGSLLEFQDVLLEIAADFEEQATVLFRSRAAAGFLDDVA